MKKSERIVGLWKQQIDSYGWVTTIFLMLALGAIIGVFVSSVIAFAIYETSKFLIALGLLLFFAVCGFVVMTLAFLYD